MSLGEALTALTDNPVAAGWLSPTMLESYLSVKRTEIALTADQTPEEMCAMYARAY
jgi:glutamine synthetase